MIELIALMAAVLQIIVLVRELIISERNERKKRKDDEK
ncbi:MAG: hypothetical protein ACI8WB_004976 [Phenylobacterium sp.]|jgi:hypothetical protein